jgi:flagellar hook-associated protein 3 FlgL
MTSVNTSAAHASAVARLGDLSRQLDAAQAQIATGRRITAPADDPVAFARASVLRREQAATDATQRAIDAGNRRLTASDTALESLGNLVQRARELALQGANGTLSADDRNAIGIELGELAAQARSLADTRDSDNQRLFGGAIADGPTYGADAAGATVWQGGGRAPAVAIGMAGIASGLGGPEIFGATDAARGSRTLFASLEALRTALADPDPTLRQAGSEAGIADLDGHVTRIADARGVLGARLGRLDSEGERLAKAKLSTESDLSKLESLDMTEAIARLQRLMTVLQAAQASFARVTSLSLWDQLR